MVAVIAGIATTAGNVVRFVLELGPVYGCLTPRVVLGFAMNQACNKLEWLNVEETAHTHVHTCVHGSHATGNGEVEDSNR